jgi:magnesium chelatase subunit H
LIILLKIYNYLQVVEQRLFSSGLHTLGESPTEEGLNSYLEAYFEDKSTDKERKAIVTQDQGLQYLLDLQGMMRKPIVFGNY